MQSKIEWLTRTTPTGLPSTNSSEDNRPPQWRRFERRQSGPPWPPPPQDTDENCSTTAPIHQVKSDGASLRTARRRLRWFKGGDRVGSSMRARRRRGMEASSLAAKKKRNKGKSNRIFSATWSRSNAPKRGSTASNLKRRASEGTKRIAASSEWIMVMNFYWNKFQNRTKFYRNEFLL
jgi:hypothetical protein